MEQTTEQKRQAILEAVASGKVSAMQLEPSRRGATIAKLKAGKPVKPETIDKLFASLQEIEQPAAQVAAPSEQSQVSSLQARIACLEEENARLKQEIKRMTEQAAAQAEQETEQTEQFLEQRLAQIEQRFCVIETLLAQIGQSNAQPAQSAQPAEQAPGSVLGYRLTTKSTTTNGKQYRKWYAVRGNSVVYVGGDPAKAEQKILAYQERGKA